MVKVRDTWRTWRRSPMTTVAVVSLVSLSIGGVTALFGPLNDLVKRPLPYPEPDTLVRIGGGIPLLDLQSRTIRERDRLSPFFEHVAAYASIGGVDSARLVTSNGPIDVSVAGVTPEFAATVRVPLRLGRDFSVGSPATEMLISERLWRSLWSEAPEVVGSPVQLGTRQRTIIGVLPKEVDLPSGVDVWVPMTTVPLDSQSVIQVIARLRPGVPSPVAVNALADLRSHLPRRATPRSGPDGPTLEALQRFIYGDQESALRMLLIASVLFLLLSCAGIATLLIAQGVRRKREMIVRVALGCSGSRVIAQLLTDTFLTVSVGGAVGLLLGSLGNRGLKAVMPDVSIAPTFASSSILLVICVCVGVTTVCGLAPAVHAARGDIGSGLKSAGEILGPRVGRRRWSYFEVFTVAQLVLAIGLMIGTGMLVSTLVGRVWVSSGIDTANVSTFRLELPRLPALLDLQRTFFTEHGMDPFGRYGPRSHATELEELARRIEPLEQEEQERNRLFFRAVVDRLASLPGITAVAPMEPVPFTDEAARPVIRRAYKERPRDPSESEQHVAADYAERRVGPGAFRALNMRLIAGRGFTEQDVREAAGGIRPAVVGEALARRLWPGENPIGKRFFDSTYRQQEHQVFGVVANDVFTGEPSSVESAVYVPLAAVDRVAGIVVRHGPGTESGRVREAVDSILSDLSPPLPRPAIRSLDSLADESLKDLRLMVSLLAAFAALGTVVAGVGVYGIVALMAAARERELAVRLALGASLWRVRGLALWGGMRVAGAAIPGGVLVGWVLVGSLAHSVPVRYGGMGLIYIGSTVLVISIAILAGLIPILRLRTTSLLVMMRQE